MNSRLHMAVAITAGFAATVLALIPLASATQEAERIAGLISPVDIAIARHEALLRIKAGDTNCSHCNLYGADFSGADLAHADFAHADLTSARFTTASIKGADLSDARGLTQAQLDLACGDKETKLPEGLHAVLCS